MATTTKLEFAVQMTCQECARAITGAVQGQQGIHSLEVNLEKEQVIVETSLSSHRVLDMIESTGKRAVLMGMGSSAGKGHMGAAVSMMTGLPGAQGVARLVQVNSDVCVVDGTVDGLRPGKHGVYIHELGDLSDGCKSCGEIFDGESDNRSCTKKYGDLCEFVANGQGRGEFRIESPRLKVWDVIGRSMVVQDKNREVTDNRVACGIVARSAGLFQNPKRICACDGVPVWDERDVPVAGSGRQRNAAAAAGTDAQL